MQPYQSMRGAIVLSALFLFPLNAGAALVEDRDVGEVRAQVRTVTIDLDACQKDYRVYEMPLPGSPSGQGTCRVAVPVAEVIPATPQTEAHVEIREYAGQLETLRLTFRGDGRAYSLTYFDRTGAGWGKAEKQFRRLLDDKLGGGRYSTIVTKVILAPSK